MNTEKGKCTLSDQELIDKCHEWISKLCKSGGEAWTLRIPVDANHDPDMVFTELIDRYSQLSQHSGIALIAKERQKQIDKHGFTGQHHAEHDEWYDNDQLQYAATTLLMHEFDEVVHVDEHVPDGWDKEWFEDLNRKPHKERLIISAALIAAELDRIIAIENAKGGQE